jgi:hypothetical protein
VWSPDGKQIFYLSPGGGLAGGPKISSVDVHTQPSVEFGKPVSLPIENISPPTGGRHYDIFPNGSQFIVLVSQAQSDRTSSQINTVLNWFSELKKQVPVK